MSKERKLAEEILQKHIEFLNGTNMRTRIVDAMDEYFSERLKSLAPTDEEIKEAANESYYSADKYRGFLDGARYMREKLTGKSEEKQKVELRQPGNCANYAGAVACALCSCDNWKQKDEEIK